MLLSAKEIRHLEAEYRKLSLNDLLDHASWVIEPALDMCFRAIGWHLPAKLERIFGVSRFFNSKKGLVLFNSPMAEPLVSGFKASGWPMGNYTVGCDLNLEEPARITRYVKQLDPECVISVDQAVTRGRVQAQVTDAIHAHKKDLQIICCSVFGSRVAEATINSSDADYYPLRFVELTPGENSPQLEIGAVRHFFDRVGDGFYYGDIDIDREKVREILIKLNERRNFGGDSGKREHDGRYLSAASFLDPFHQIKMESRSHPEMLHGDWMSVDTFFSALVHHHFSGFPYTLKTSWSERELNGIKHLYNDQAFAVLHDFRRLGYLIRPDAKDQFVYTLSPKGFEIYNEIFAPVVKDFYPARSRGYSPRDLLFRQTELKEVALSWINRDRGVN